MSRLIVSTRRWPLFGIGSRIAIALGGIAHRLHVKHEQYATAAQLENLTDRLRQDIGLADSSPTAAELIKRFHLSQRPLPREHEKRFKLWV